MADDMFFSDAESALQRGRRGAPRTETCRPCLLNAPDFDGDEFEGVVMDLTPFGMRVRMVDELPVGTEVSVQLMRDDQFSRPLSRPLPGTVVRLEESAHGFTDHGVKLLIQDIPRIHPRSAAMEPARPFLGRNGASRRMIDYTVGDGPALPPNGRA